MAFTFNSNGYNITCAVVDASGSTSKTITMGSSLWTVNGSKFDLSGSGITLNANTSEASLENNMTVNVGSLVLNNLTSNVPNVTFTLTGTVTVSGTLDLQKANQASTWNGGTLAAQGDVKISQIGNAVTVGGTTALNFTGSSNQTMSTGNSSSIFNLAITVNKSGGTLTLSGSFGINSNFTHTAGTVSTTGNTITWANSLTIKTGTITWNNMNFGAGSITITLTDNLTASGTIDLNTGSGTLTFNSSTINAQGDIKTSGTGGVSGTSTLTINGTGSQTLSSGGGTINPPITINKSSGTLTLSGTIPLGGNFTYTAGTVSSGTSTIRMSGTVNHNSGTISFNNWTVNSGTTTLTGNLTVTGTLTIASGATLSAGSNTITANGNWTNNGTFTSGTSTVTFGSTSTLAGATTFNSLTFSPGATLTFTAAQTFTVNATFTALGTSASNITLNSTVASSYWNFTLATNSTQNSSNNYLLVTDSDASGGNEAEAGQNGTLTRTINWATPPDNSYPASFSGYIWREVSRSHRLVGIGEL